MNNSAPKYIQIMVYYSEKIERKELREGDKIPGEEEIGRLFNVSRITVRNALNELARKDYIIKIQGKGSFVKTRKTGLQLNSLQGFSEEMISKGLKPSTKLEAIQIIEPDPEVAKLLQVDVNVKIYDLKRLRYADDTVMAIEHVRIPFFRCVNLDKHNLEQSLYSVFEKEYNLHIIRAKQSIEAGLINKSNAKLMNIRAGEPVLNIYRISYTENDIPLEYVESIYRGDCYKFHVDLERIQYKER
ncbi:MAG: GntR family transcriptional regulator [Cellulosilyticaceae bacterium]